jgi:hypothetical protein
MTIRNPQINIRVNPELKDKLHELAVEKGNSVNFEIVSRLEESLLAEKPPSELITASEAKSLAEKTRRDGLNKLISTCVSKIHESIGVGVNEFSVNLTSEYDFYGDKTTSTYTDIIQPAYDKLISLGYSVKIQDGNFYIKF